MRTFLVLLVMFGAAVYFNQSHRDPVDSRQSDAQAVEFDEAYKAGSKFKGPGCYRITDSSDSYYGCEFFNEQGSMFLQGVDKKPKWMLIFNKKIYCLGDGPDFVDEATVEKIDCPSEFYK